MVAIAKRNSTQSPLLRLPGEIRNLIYAYSTGHYIIYHTSAGRLIVGPADPWDWRHAFVEFPSVTGLLSLTLVCRQTYLEARLDVFTNNTFDTKNFFYFRRCADRLTKEQKNAITTTTCDFDCMGKIGSNVFPLTGTIDYTEHFLIKPYLDVLLRFTGLKRVVMDSSKVRLEDDNWKRLTHPMEKCAISGARRFFQNKNLEIEFVQTYRH
ncbi:uncharacterized protein N0V89_011078 [Didymosphaeria variabile]|uniref:Uncharacterized protein n=1 Tax=Didymosphaeria variabile TaxID=1932322 RepID=A0A9W8XCU9_9PLEO|nr:uncharacterized protein N0V89_011078 [Didymosphaeria variabile]KAJ4347140.1 hypothetical protein N0V89_011078 [Didymosphaeria variabile]